GPVAAQLEEIVEVDESQRLELDEEVVERRVADERPDGEERTFYPELVRGEVESLVELGAGEADALEGVAPDEQRGATAGDVEGHGERISSVERGRHVRRNAPSCVRMMTASNARRTIPSQGAARANGVRPAGASRRGATTSH